MRTECYVFLFAAIGGMALAQQKDIVVNVPGPRAGAITAVAVMGGEMVGGPAVTEAPYSAEAVTETTQTLPDGNRIVNKSSSKIYRDSAGRERREQTIGPFGRTAAEPTPTSMIMISDPVANVNYSMDTGSKTATKMLSSPLPTVTARGGVVGGPVFTQVMPAQFAGGNHVFFSQGTVRSYFAIGTEEGRPGPAYHRRRTGGRNPHNHHHPRGPSGKRPPD